jgi:Glyoxalase-like domain
VSDSIKFGGVTLDCPNAGELAAFYARITGGEVTVPGDDWAMMTCPDGADICFQAAPDYVPPSWPDAASSLQMHLDFDVDDLDSTEAVVLAAGATKYAVQPNSHCRVYADPVGHPFCLSTASTLSLRES